MRRHIDKWLLMLAVLGAGSAWSAAQVGGGSANKFPTVSHTDRILGRQSAGAGAIEEITCTPFARSVLDDVDAAAVRSTIGAGTGSGTVTDVTGTSPIASTGGTTPALSLNDTAVTPGSYTYSALTVDAKGRLTSASSGTSPYVPGGTDVAVADGGTGASTLTANAVMLGAGTWTPQFATIGTAGRVLIDQGAGVNPAFTVIGGQGALSSAGVFSLTPTNRHLYGLRSAAVGGSCPAWAPASNSNLLISGRLRVVPIYLYAGTTVTNISFCSATTPYAVDASPHWWFALYDSSQALLSQTADQTSTAWPANTVKTLALGAAQLISTTDVYYLAIMVEGTTMPTIATYIPGAGYATALWTNASGVTSDTGLAGTAPDPFGAITAGILVPWCEAS